MIKFRLSSMSHELDGKEYFLENTKLLSHVVSDVLFEENLSDAKDIFVVLVNGNIIEPELYAFTSVGPEDQILITPRIKGGRFGQVFKQVAVVLVSAAAVYYSAGLGAGWAAAIGGITALGATLTLNSLIPAPNVGLGGSSEFGDAEKSQMYSISSQSNSVSKYGAVSKTYGTHRLFPTIVANPYTDIEVDVSTGELVQFFYAIYDFGHGPMEVTDLKIGETPITNFADFEYKLVDLNKPVASEGPWDDVLNSNSVYKPSNV